MRTLVFCTAYAEHPSAWADRYRPWLDAVVRGFGADEILLVDDGSASLPGWPDVQVASVDVLGDAFTVSGSGPVLLAHFRHRLGRADVLNFPGWHRSFCFAALYAERHGFDRVIHIESDAYVISARARDFLRRFGDGWAAFWAARFHMPESAIQVVAGEGLRALAQFARQPYGPMIGRSHERDMPFTQVARQFRGDRYGDHADRVPADVDYAAQVPSRRERAFSWFASGLAAAEPAQTIRRHFGLGGDGVSALSDGWSAPEPHYQWMLGAESSLVLPGVSGTGDAVLRLSVTPHVFADRLIGQRLIVEVNGYRAREFYITVEVLLGCDIPAQWLGRDGGDVLRLIHPDAAAPCDLSPGESDTRRLSVSLHWLELAR